MRIRRTLRAVALGFTVVPAVGGVLVAGLGTGAAFLFDAATFLWSITFLASMRPRPVEPSAPQRFMRDLADGFREVRSRTWVWVSIVAVGLTLMIQVAPIQVLGPVIAREHFGGAAAWAAMEAAFGAGTVLGGVTALPIRAKTAAAAREPMLSARGPEQHRVRHTGATRGDRHRSARGRLVRGPLLTGLGDAPAGTDPS
jgi:Transmembrane secretion effector